MQWINPHSGPPRCVTLRSCERRPAAAVARVAVADGTVVVVGADRGLAAHRWLPPRDLGAFTFSAPAEAGFAVEADAAPPRALGAPFAADALSGDCYAVLPGSQARAPHTSECRGVKGARKQAP